MLLDWKSVETRPKDSKPLSGLHWAGTCVKYTAQNLLNYAELCKSRGRSGSEITKILHDISKRWLNRKDLRKLLFEQKSVEERHVAVSHPQRLM